MFIPQVHLVLHHFFEQHIYSVQPRSSMIIEILELFVRELNSEVQRRISIVVLGIDNAPWVFQ